MSNAEAEAGPEGHIVDVQHVLTLLRQALSPLLTRLSPQLSTLPMPPQPAIPPAPAEQPPQAGAAAVHSAPGLAPSDDSLGPDLFADDAMRAAADRVTPYAPQARPPTGHRLCVLIPFRDSDSATSQGGNRTANLRELYPRLVKHLEQHAHMQLLRDFEILVIEQSPGALFNKGALFDVGFDFAESRGAECDYYVLHDVDQAPLSPLNTYAYPSPEAPRHLCTASSQFNYQQAYGSMVGGALAITREQFKRMNGYSIYYWGWGQEDDDFYFRIERTFGHVERLDEQAGRYLALSHPRVKDLDMTPVFYHGTDHLRATLNGQLDFQKDGLSNLRYSIVRDRVIAKGVKVITAKLMLDWMPKTLTDKPPAG